MGLPLLLPLLLLLASLQAGEWPELSCSARDPREELWLGVCRRVPWGSWPGLPPPTNKRRVPQCWVPQPLTLLPAPSLERGSRRPEGQSYPVARPPAGEGARWWGHLLCLSWWLQSLSLPPLGHRAQRNSQQHYEMKQPSDLSAPEGGSILIPFSFSHPGELAKDPNMRISWRWKHYHGEFIYNTTPLFTHKNFKDRLILNWAEPEKNGSLRISNLRREDESVYFCRVELVTLRDGKEEWQSIEGTKLTITRRESSCPA